MEKNGAAQNAQRNATPLTVVQNQKGENKTPIINLKKAAEEVKAEEVTTQEQTKEPIQEQPKTISQDKPLSIEEIKRKHEKLSRLTAKWDELTEKRRRVENFSISHDQDTATARVRDANGETFDSNSPKTISKLIEFWLDEFSEGIQKIEKELRELA